MRACPECRELAREMRENAIALSALREEPLPGVVIRPAARSRYHWIAAAAAALICALLLAHWRRPSAPVVPVAAVPPRVELPAAPDPPPAPLPQPRPRPGVQTAPAEPLTVKMLTPDPEVVVYWIVEPKEKAE